MSRQNRPQSARDGGFRGGFPPPPPSVPSPRSLPLAGPQARPDDAAPAAPVVVTAVPSPEPVAVTVTAPPAPAPPRFVALVRIHADRVYEPGEEIPASVAMDGLAEGEVWRRG